MQPWKEDLSESHRYRTVPESQGLVALPASFSGLTLPCLALPSLVLHAPPSQQPWNGIIPVYICGSAMAALRLPGRRLTYSIRQR